MAGSCIVAIESMKQAARRPSPPFPSPASGSCSSNSLQRIFSCWTACFVNESRRRFEILFVSERPIRNSIER